jgi:hypothetical protein
MAIQQEVRLAILNTLRLLDTVSCRCHSTAPLDSVQVCATLSDQHQDQMR